MVPRLACEMVVMKVARMVDFVAGVMVRTKEML